MLTCKETAVLISKGLEQKLPLSKRLALQLHIKMCKACSRYKKQLLATKKLSKAYFTFAPKKTHDSPEEILSEEAKKRIKESIRKNTG